jgi:hypothetical protein
MKSLAARSSRVGGKGQAVAQALDVLGGDGAEAVQAAVELYLKAE